MEFTRLQVHEDWTGGFRVIIAGWPHDGVSVVGEALTAVWGFMITADHFYSQWLFGRVETEGQVHFTRQNPGTDPGYRCALS